MHIMRLKPCPVCRCEVRVTTDGTWHRIIGKHTEECTIVDGNDVALSYPAEPGALAEMVKTWNSCTVPKILK